MVRNKMSYTLLEIAYGALLHDIGKFYQRAMPELELNQEALSVVPFHKKGGYHSHLHAAYTSCFIDRYLSMSGDLEKIISEHHIHSDEHVHEIIQRADRIASAIDRQDEESDIKRKNKRGSFITSRLHSVLSEVDFGKKREDIIFPLSTLRQMNQPQKGYQLKNREESVKEYKQLFDQFVKEIQKDTSLNNKIDLYAYNRMYNLLNQYLVTVPASTYENDRPAVSLFDHLKLTSAIASCLYDETCFNEDKFYMLELDVSGIQSFIYQVAQGSETKPGLARALRGRSILVGIITNAVAYAFINAFGLTQSNILFNTGGGALILLPYSDNTEAIVEKVSKTVRQELFKMFQTDITFVDALIELTADELESFQSDKALELKEKLGRNKMRKFYDVVDDSFFYEKIDNNQVCRLCGRPSATNQCDVCAMADDISNIYTHFDSFGIVYDYNHKFKGQTLDIKRNKLELKFVDVYFVSSIDAIIEPSVFVDSINDFGIGAQKMLANSVPLNDKRIQLNFEQILELTPRRFGDRKLAILKMDVDNLGGIFAFGLKKTKEPKTQRSISKYVTMSRLFEYFFGKELVTICEDVSNTINPHLKTSNHTLFYINYAGGDDLVIIGSAYAIVYLALEIYKRFSEFTGNQNITISGGIHIQNEKKPIRFGIQQADDALEHSKSEGKNAITLIDTKVRFPDYEKLLKEVDHLRRLIIHEEVSRTMIYNIMSNISDKSYKEYVCLVPILQYTLFRNIGRDGKKKNNYAWMLKLINNVEQSDDSVKLLELKLKLALLFTREEKN